MTPINNIDELHFTKCYRCYKVGCLIRITFNNRQLVSGYNIEIPLSSVMWCCNKNKPEDGIILDESITNKIKLHLWSDGYTDVI